MKKIYLFAIFLLVCHSTFSQRFYSVVFDQLPRDMQLYPREANNLAKVPISGRIEVAGWSYMSVQVFRKNVPIGYYRANLNYGNANATKFVFPDIYIKAEPADYEFRVYACKTQDSILMVTRQKVVAGDFYVINGQSNGTAFNVGNVPYTYFNEYLRTFGISNDGQTFSTADTLWNYPDRSFPYVGAWGLHLQRLILEKYGIPTCIINASIPGTFISEHLQRVAEQHDNFGTIYGSLLYRVTKAQALNHIKCFFWWQGEQDIIYSKTSYPEDFQKLYNYWREDYPAIRDFMIFQMNILPAQTATGASIRDFQRKIPSLFPYTSVHATAGAYGYDGGHYSREGYQQIALQVFNRLQPLYYDSSVQGTFTSPNIKAAYFSSKAQNQVVLEFDTNQKMVAVSDTTVVGASSHTNILLSVKDYFYFDENEANTPAIEAIQYQNNKVILSYKSKLNYKTISYLPNTYRTSDVPVFIGPCLRNSAGNTACAFSSVAIEDAPILASPTLTAEVMYYNKVQLKWTKAAIATQYQIEKKRLDEPISAFTVQARIDSSIRSFVDTTVTANTSIVYRIKAISSVAESAYSYDTVVTPALLAQPILSATILYNNLVKLSWPAVSEATKYLLRRIEGNTVATLLNASSLTFTDTTQVGKVYRYEIQAFGNKTESGVASIQVSMPAILPTPTVSVQNITYESVQLNWNAVETASLYRIERQQADMPQTAFELVAELQALTFTDKALKANQEYLYRVKALSTISASNYGTVTAKTVQVLATEEELLGDMSVYPNPASDYLMFHFYQPFSGKMVLLTLTGQLVLEGNVSTSKLYKLALPALPKGVYLVNLESNSRIISKKVLVE